MTNLIHFFDCLVLTLQVFGKIIVNFSPAIVMIVVFVLVMKVIELIENK